MGLFSWLLKLLWPTATEVNRPENQSSNTTHPARSGEQPIAANSDRTGNLARSASRSPAIQPPSSANQPSGSTSQLRRKAWRPVVRMFFLSQYRIARSERKKLVAPGVSQRPYRFAYCDVMENHQYVDHSLDADSQRLGRFKLPEFSTPDELAAWLEIPIGQLAWLTHHSQSRNAPACVADSHYVYSAVRKRSGGYRLIESPKAKLRAVQQTILRELLDHVPAHPAAHGFVVGRSALTNAIPHCGQAVVLKIDLRNFYTSVRLNRVIAIFRGLGYSRIAAIWLARLTTAALPGGKLERGLWDQLGPDLAGLTSHHLPQGASTSPALANLSAFGLDVRLSALAKTFGGCYTRYADDLTFSGDASFRKSLRLFLPLVLRIIRNERFQPHPRKIRVLRSRQRQSVTGVVVNEKPNVARPDFDRLKAILYNCVKQGPRSQNRNGHEHFAAHLHGRISAIQALNLDRARKLWALYAQIDWTR